VRRQAIAKELAGRRRQRLRRLIVVALNVVAFGAAAEVAWRLVTRSRTLRAQLAHAEARFADDGWVEIASNVVTASRSLEADVQGSSCFVAVSTRDALLRIREGGRSFEGERSVGFCTCEPGRAVIEASAVSTGGNVGVALMRIDARAIGGPLARAWTAVAPAAWGSGGMECADAMLDAWIADGHGVKEPTDETWLDTAPARASLRSAGFRVVSTVQSGRPFGVVPASAGDCLLAVAGNSELLSLRARGGGRLIARARGAMAWCGSEAATTTVWREGRSSVVTLEAPAVALGGLLGVRECAEAAGERVAPEATWLADADLAWDAASLLRASVHASRPSDVVAAPLPVEPGVPDMRLVALTLSPAARVASDPPSPLVACDPTLGVASVLRQSVCAHVGPVTWWRQGDAPAAAARAALPFWLSLLEPIHEPDAVTRIPQLLALARRLGTDAFIPTVLESVTEIADGVRVVGRANEDAIVAVGLGPQPPWVFPFTDRVTWTLGDSPRVVPLRPGESVKLTASPPPNAPLEKRRTVVFRRAARP
jgi:hypothetical protein